MQDLNCTTPEVWAPKLGWESEAELMVDGTETFFVDLLFAAGFYLQCTNLGVKVAERCEVNQLAAELTNEATGEVHVEFLDPFQVLAGLKLLTCTMGGGETGEIEGLLTMSEFGVNLSVSSE